MSGRSHLEGGDTERPRAWLSRLRRPLAAVLGVGCVVYLGRLLWLRREAVVQALDLDAGTLALLLLLVFASHLQRAFEFDYMLKRLGVREPFREGFLVTGAAQLLNYLPFSAGSVARAITLRRKHSLPYSFYLSALLVATIVHAAVAALAGLVSTLALSEGARVLPLVLLFAATVLGGGLVVCFPRAWAPGGRSRVEHRIRDIVEAAALIRHHGAGLAVLATTAFGKMLLNCLRMGVCFRALGVELSAFELVLLGSTAVLTSLVNLAPGNIGLRELLLGGLWGIIGGSPAVGMAAATLDRAVLLVYTVIAGVPGIVHVRRALAATSEPGRSEPAKAASDVSS
ncbi:MAG TPA: lysylphosphatidylglycerol synthase domain-containing protein [Polyangiaceae bacterium]|nr:lysylphosphatidylglycerol synthase domain-containing protein [Polyangiaceae bacterium]